jgi:hypothetical protein
VQQLLGLHQALDLVYLDCTHGDVPQVRQQQWQQQQQWQHKIPSISGSIGSLLSTPAHCHAIYCSQPAT